MRCEFGDHKVEKSLDYITHERADGEIFVYCTSHEPITKNQRTKLKRWAGERNTSGPL